MTQRFIFIYVRSSIEINEEIYKVKKNIMKKTILLILILIVRLRQFSLKRTVLII